MDEAVERAVTVMRSRYHERLSVAELAAEAFFSPFHFSRVFRRELGVSPVQYLTAVRLFEAKRLLQGTPLNVADIACRVGYFGIGTFTTRFTSLVGVSPGHYRRLPPGRMLTITDREWQLPNWDGLPASRHQRTPVHGPHGHGGAIIGSAEPTAGCAPSRLFVGVFDETIPQGPPVAWDLVPATAEWQLDNLPTGSWVVMAVAEDGARRPFGPGGYGSACAIGTSDPVEVTAGATTEVTLRMRRPKRTDPPILIPLCHCLPQPQSLVAV
jgi:AraC family transcriptional regulator